MTCLTFVFSLKKSHEAYGKELKRAKDDSPEYFQYLRNLSFGAFIEQVISACAMYPRSIDQCRLNLTDLSYGIINELGVGSDRLSSYDTQSLAYLVDYCGQEVFRQLDGSGYYLNPRRFPKGYEDDVNFETDLTAVSKTKMVNDYTVKVTTDEYHFDNVEVSKTYLLDGSLSRNRHLIPKH